MACNERTTEADRTAFLGLMKDMRPWQAVGHGLDMHAHRLEDMELSDDVSDPDPDKEAYCRAEDRRHFATLYQAIKTIEERPQEALAAALCLDSPFLAYVAQYLGMIGSLCARLDPEFAREFRSHLIAASMPDNRGHNHRRIIRVWLIREGFEPSQDEVDAMWLRAINRTAHWVDIDEIHQLHSAGWLPSSEVAAEILAHGTPKHDTRVPSKIATFHRTLLTLSAIASKYGTRDQFQMAVGL